MKIKLLPFLLLCAIPLNPVLSIANDDYIVSASRFTLPMNQVGYDVTVFTEEDLEKKQITTLDEALRYVPGITITENGIGIATAFARGSKGNALLVLVDGIPINDPTQPTFDMNSIAVGTAERVEVVLGAQSAMYGAGALAGVVNIITKEGEGALNGSVYLEGGYPLNGKLQAQVNGSNEKLSYALGLTGRYSNAISAYNGKNWTESETKNAEELDPFYDVNFNASLKYTFSNMFNVRLTANETYQDYAYDNYDTYNDNFEPFAADYNATTLRSLVSVKPELILFDGFWTQSLGLSYINTQRDYPDPYPSEYWDNTSEFSSQGVRVDWQHKLVLDTQNIAFGILYQFDQQFEGIYYGSPSEADDLNNVALYAEYSVNPLDSLYLNASARADKYDKFDTLGLSGSLAVAYTLPTNTSLRASVGKGFGAPSLEQLATNSELEPEESFTWDIGATQAIGDIAQVSLGYYQAYYTNLIYNLGWGQPYFNGSEQESQGISFGVDVEPIEALSLALSGTYELTEDYKGDRPTRLPDYTINFDADYRLPVGNNALVGLSLLHVGEREDSYPVGYVLDPYTLLNFRAQADVIDNLTLYLKVNNILNQEYEECAGYSTLGINANLGVKYVF